MSRINTNVGSMIAQRVLGQNNFALGNSLERLSTGLRINRGKDDPAGLIASENLRGEISSLNAAVGNAERADQVINVAEGGLQEVSNLLTELQGLLTSSASAAGLSTEEKEANQLQIDSILQTVDRISGATSFQGIKLLNGNFDYQVSSVASSVTDYEINGAKFETATLDVDAIVTQSAQKAGLFMEFATSSLDLATGSAFVVEIAGDLGSRELSFSSGQTMTQIATAINAFTEVTGVVASATATGTGVALSSSAFGSSEFVSVKVASDSGTVTGANTGIYEYLSGAFGTTETTGSEDTFASTAAKNGIRDSGQDIAGTINGISATGKGKELAINTDFLDVKFRLSDSASQNLAAVDAFTITGGGADFQLAGKVDVAGKVSIGISDLSVRNLGRSDLGYLDELGGGKKFNVVDDGNDLTTAQKVVAEAIKTVSATRGRLGAFQKNVVGSTIRSLGVAIENTSAAESTIRDADFAAETASLTRNQILVSASTNILGLANSQPQSVLQLLG